MNQVVTADKKTRYKVWVSFAAESRETAASRALSNERGWAASRIFELSEREFEELWPGLRRVLDER